MSARYSQLLVLVYFAYSYLQNLADDSEEHNGKYRKAYGIVKLLCP